MSDPTFIDSDHVVPRLYRLELRADYHEDQLVSLHRDNQAQQKMLESINKRLSAIFWAIVGAVAIALANEFGGLEVLLKVL